MSILLQAAVTGPSASVAPVGALAIWLALIANAAKVAEVAVVMYGVYKYVASRGERRAAEKNAAELARTAANYQAWQVVNSAQGKGGSGGRVDALNDLKTNDVSLAGVHLDGAWLEAVDLRDAILARATFVKANLKGAVLERANLEFAALTDANLMAAKLGDAYLKGADLCGAVLSTSDLRGADLSDLRGWQQNPVDQLRQDRRRAERPAGLPRMGAEPWGNGRGAGNRARDGRGFLPGLARRVRAIDL
ncbi:MAG TPA: pentapeptide repeat-containing protein, partial [Gemmatimonadales bacterium]|nr:pentapeptide repeat-containing protein [Gemmatimonadales bacterium]